MAAVPDWYYTQSGVLAYRRGAGGIEVVLITSRRRRRWVIPKGVVERSLTPAESAAKEAFEEAGVTGPLDPRPVGRYDYRKWGGTCTVEVFLLRVREVLEEWAESEVRERQWLSPSQASRLVEEPALSELIRALPQLVPAAGPE